MQYAGFCLNTVANFNYFLYCICFECATRPRFHPLCLITSSLSLSPSLLLFLALCRNDANAPSLVMLFWFSYIFILCVHFNVNNFLVYASAFIITRAFSLSLYRLRVFRFHSHSWSFIAHSSIQPIWFVCILPLLKRVTFAIAIFFAATVVVVGLYSFLLHSYYETSWTKQINITEIQSTEQRITDFILPLVGFLSHRYHNFPPDFLIPLKRASPWYLAKQMLYRAIHRKNHNK